MVTVAVPAVAISVAGTRASTSVEEINVVASGLPFQYAVEEVKKSDPFKTSVNWDPPAVVEVGSMDESTGAELMTVNVCSFEVPPPGTGFTTVTG
jgi:hypothetical protein